MAGKILMDGVNVRDDASITSFLGAVMNLKIEGEDDDGAPTQIRWNISGTGNISRKYEMKKRKATSAGFMQYSKANISFYWLKEGKFKIEAQARFKGRYWRKSFKVHVKGPNVTSFRTETDDVKIAVIDNPGTGLRSLALTFGGDVKPGILNTIKVTAPAVRSEFAITQLMTIDRKKEFDSGATDSKSSAGESPYVLDEDVFYGFTNHDEASTVVVAANHSETLKHEDSPASILSRTEFRGNVLSKVSINENFKTYLMYRPEDGIWMSIARVDWYWRGTATWHAGDTEWKLSGASNSRNPSATMAIEQPLWNNNRDYIL